MSIWEVLAFVLLLALFFDQPDYENNCCNLLVRFNHINS